MALAAGFVSAVADRFGVWGPRGASNVAWGDFETFTSYAARINPWAPAAMVPFLAWAATALEVALAVALLAGFRLRWTGVVSGLLLLAFAAGMTVGTGVKTALDASVFAAAGAAFALAWLSGGASRPGPTD